jgi:hypothetical protein
MMEQKTMVVAIRNGDLRSYFGRVNYSFKDRYLLEANGRFDGSSRFTGDNQYSFLSVVLGRMEIVGREFLGMRWRTYVSGD